MVGKLAGVGPFFIPMQLPSVPRHQRMHACWRDPKRSQDLGRGSLAPFFPLAKIIFHKKKSLYFGSSVWVWLRFGAGDRSAQGISAVTCRGLPTRVQIARSFALRPRPCAASVRALRRANFKASSSNRCRSMPSSMQSQQQRASGSGSSVLPSPNRCSLSFCRPCIRRLNCAVAPFSSQTLAFRHSSPLRPAHSRNSPAET
jgi:hypothetical protein